MDNPEKFQYSKSDIVAHCGADILKYITSTGTDKLKVVAEIQDWIDDNECFEFEDLAKEVDKTVGISKGIQEDIQELEPKRTISRGHELGL